MVPQGAPREKRALRRAALVAGCLAIAAGVLFPAGASANGGNTVDTAVVLSIGDSDFGGVQANNWYKWSAGPTPPASVTLSDCQVNYDTLLSVYSGPASNPTLGSLVAVTSNDDGIGCGTNLGSRLKFTPVANTTYYFNLSTVSGFGNFNMHFYPTPANDDFASAATLPATTTPSASGTNDGGTKEPGEPNHAGFNSGASVWWKWTAPVSGTYKATDCQSNFHPILGVYTGASVSALTTVGSAPNCGTGAGIATFIATMGTTYYFAVDGDDGGGKQGGETGTFTLSVGLVPANDDLANAATLSGSTANASGNNLGASAETSENDHAGLPATQSVWYRWTAPDNLTYQVDTCGSSADTLLDVFPDGPTFPLSAAIASNDDSCGTSSKLSFNAVSGLTYLIAVDTDGLGGAFNLEILPAPDTTPPDTIIDAPIPTSPSTDTTPTYNFHSTENPATFECSMTTGGNDFHTCASPFTPAPLTDGDYTFKVRATDGSHNTDLSPATANFTVDTHGPVVSIKKAPPAKIKTTRSKVKVHIRFKSTAPDLQSMACSLDGAAPTACTSPASYKVGKGKHTFTVRGTDQLGNQGPEATATWKVVHLRGHHHRHG